MIYADDRENEVLLHRLRAKVGDRRDDPKGQCVVKRLREGDYIIGPYGIEAKEINDLYRSILGIGRNGRTIKHQLAELCEAVEVPILAIYNTQLKPYFKGRRPTGPERAREIAKQQRIIKSFKHLLYAQFPKVRMIEFATMDEFVEWLATMNIQDAVRGRPAIMENRNKRQPSEDPRIAALAGIPGITEEIAENLLNEFGGLRGLLRTRNKQKDFMRVKGVGRVTARRLKQFGKTWESAD